jgi:hypothetical protein
VGVNEASFKSTRIHYCVRVWEEHWKTLSFETCLVETYLINRQCDITLLCGPLDSAAFASLDHRPVSWPDR